MQSVGRYSMWTHLFRRLFWWMCGLISYRIYFSDREHEKSLLYNYCHLSSWQSFPWRLKLSTAEKTKRRTWKKTLKQRHIQRHRLCPKAVKRFLPMIVFNNTVRSIIYIYIEYLITYLCLSLPYEPFHQQGAVKVNEQENKMWHTQYSVFSYFDVA